MKGGMPQMYGGIFGRWLIGKLEYANKDYVSGSNGHDNLAIRGKNVTKAKCDDNKRLFQQ